MTWKLNALHSWKSRFANLGGRKGKYRQMRVCLVSMTKFLPLPEMKIATSVKVHLNQNDDNEAFKTKTKKDLCTQIHKL